MGLRSAGPWPCAGTSGRAPCTCLFARLRRGWGRCSHSPAQPFASIFHRSRGVLPRGQRQQTRPRSVAHQRGKPRPPCGAAGETEDPRRAGLAQKPGRQAGLNPQPSHIDRPWPHCRGRRSREGPRGKTRRRACQGSREPGPQLGRCGLGCTAEAWVRPPGQGGPEAPSPFRASPASAQDRPQTNKTAPGATETAPGGALSTHPELETGRESAPGGCSAPTPAHSPTHQETPLTQGPWP